ncbi:MAG: hypothetical protein IPG68_07050 [Micrococcales bacterium]|nr:hypothetical protein [Micrococcales bacterium]
MTADQGPRRLDDYWDELLHAAEIDGRAHHVNREAFEPDARRLIIRYSAAAVRYDRRYVLENTEANMEARRALSRGYRPRG